MHPMLNIAVKAARRAGGIINRAGRNLDVIAVREKTANDFVSEVDREAEKAIIQTLREAYPAHAILAEESGASGKSDYEWIIDPLDGTTNFLHGIPHFAISIALARDGVAVAGVVYNPATDDLFVAERGKGAFLNEQRIRVAARKRLHDCVITCGLPHYGRGDLALGTQETSAMQAEVAGLRRFGAAALDLAWVAAGRFDGYWERNLQPWDIAAGLVLVREAGGFVTDMVGKDAAYLNGDIVAGNDTVLRQMVKVLKGAR